MIGRQTGKEATRAHAASNASPGVTPANRHVALSERVTNERKSSLVAGTATLRERGSWEHDEFTAPLVIKLPCSRHAHPQSCFSAENR